MKSKKCWSIRQFLFWLLLTALAWLVVSRFTEIETLIKTLKQGRWPWILLAGALQAGYYVLYAALFHFAFYAVGIASRLRNLVFVTLGAVFVNTVAPSGGMAGLALFIDDAARHQQSPARAAAGTLLVSIVDFGAFTVVLVAGLVYLFLRHDLKLYEIIAALSLLLFTAGQAGVLLLGLWQPTLLHRLLSWVQRIVNALAHKFRLRPLPSDWATRNAAEFTEAAAAISSHPWRLGPAVGVGLAAHAVNLASLYTLFRAFQQGTTFGTLVAGYAMGVLFLNISPIPQGIGVVEATMVLVFASLGVSSESALVITLTFRGLTFWVPLALGALVLHKLKSFH